MAKKPLVLPHLHEMRGETKKDKTRPKPVLISTRVPASPGAHADWGPQEAEISPDRLLSTVVDRNPDRLCASLARKDPLAL